MSKIFTKTGDEGFTSLANGQRVPKDDARIEFNGEIDKLNAMLGLLKVSTGSKEPYEDIQHLLMKLMGFVAQPDHQPTEDELQPFKEAVEEMERMMKDEEDHHPFVFVLPGKSLHSAWLHLVRTQVRTCERRWCSLCKEASQPAILEIYLNRLSDYFFVLALKD